VDLSGKKIAILATNGFEQAELEVPLDRLKKAGATVDIVSLVAGEIKGWDKKDWGSVGQGRRDSRRRVGRRLRRDSFAWRPNQSRFAAG
jgi:putative intracellular protease/amidase